jgi:hypothetical protein
MKYMFLLIGEEETWANASDEERQQVMAEFGQLDEELRAAGKQVEGYELALSNAATTTRFDSGRQTVVDGPFAEAREQLGGYFVFDCADLDEALGWARKMPHGDGSIEIRPIVDHR